MAGSSGLPSGDALIDGDGKIAAHRVSVHRGHHVHRAALAPQFDGLRESGGIDFLVAEHLAAETDDGGVLFIQTGERTVVSNDVDHLGVDSSLETAGLMPVPLQVVVGFAAGDQNREFARVRIERSARHGGVMEIQQSLRDARVIGSEGERAAQGAILAGKDVENLLALRVQFGLLQIRKAGPRLGIQVGRELRLSIGDQAMPRLRAESRPTGARMGKGSFVFSPSLILLAG